MRCRALLVILGSMTTIACAGASPPEPELVEPEDGLAPTYASRFGDGERIAITPPERPSELLLAVRRTTAAEGEDGAGNVVPVTNGIELVISERPFPTGAVAPTLSIGDRLFVAPATQAGTLVYVVADAATLPAVGELAITAGGTRTVIEAAFSVPADL